MTMTNEIKKAIGYISYTHGLDGKVKVVPMVPKHEFEDCILNKEITIDNDKSEQLLQIRIFAFTGKIFLCKISGIDDIQSAAKLTKHEIFIKVPQDSNFIDPETLLDFDVFTTEEKNEKYGKVVDFGDYGSGDLIEIKTTKGKRVLLLCNGNMIKNINRKENYLIIDKEVIS